MPVDAPKPPGFTRFVLTSDTHSRTDSLQMPYGDVLIHAGDFTELGLPSEVHKFNDWLELKDAGHFTAVNFRKGRVLRGTGVHVTSASSGVKLEMPESPQMKEEPEEHGIKQEEDELQIAVGVKVEESCLLQEIPEGPQTKEEPEEQRIKQEEEQLLVCVKTEESSLLQQRQLYGGAHVVDMDFPHEGVHITSVSFEGLRQEVPESPRMKEEPEEHGIKQEEDEQQIAVSVKTEVPESPQTEEEPEEQRIKREEEQLPVCVKSEELRQKRREHREETRGEDESSETEGDTEHSSDEEADLHHIQPLSSDDGDDLRGWSPLLSLSVVVTLLQL
uniref:Uncharacterized protein n=1 Tax=Knipowitschia caucasica TaxID=637954 RepID=A0AAV2LDX1_KNICA